MKNSADLGGCYPQRPKASVDNTLLDLQNSSYPTQPHSIIANYWLVFIRISLCMYLYRALLQLFGDSFVSTTIANFTYPGVCSVFPSICFPCLCVCLCWKGKVRVQHNQNCSSLPKGMKDLKKLKGNLSPQARLRMRSPFFRSEFQALTSEGKVG